jgi:hypothetical protein
MKKYPARSDQPLQGKENEQPKAGYVGKFERNSDKTGKSNGGTQRAGQVIHKAKAIKALEP